MKTKKIIGFFLISFMIHSCTKDDSILPMERNQTISSVNNIQMEEVRIGRYIWTTKNLDVDRIQIGIDSGKLIKKIENSSEWDRTKEPAWCWYMNDSIRYSSLGRIYNGYAINGTTRPNDIQGGKGAVIPKGYHVPTINEWNDLFQTLGNYVNDYENSPFKLLYGGYRDFYGSTNSLGWYQGFSPINEANFWTNQIAPSTYSMTRPNDLISIKMKKNYRGTVSPAELTDWRSWPISTSGFLGLGRRADREKGMFIRLVKDY